MLRDSLKQVVRLAAQVLREIVAPEPLGMAMPGASLSLRIITILSVVHPQVSRLRIVSVATLCAATIGIFALTTIGRAQPSPSSLAFEVASVRPHEALGPREINGRMVIPGPRMSFSGSRVTIENESLRGLIAFAYDLKIDDVSGAPRWAESQRFDIAAKAPGDGDHTRDQFRQMMQSLLADRFQLKFHLNTKETSGYALVVAKNGPRLTTSAPDSVSSMSLRSTNYAEMTMSKWTMEQLSVQLSFMVEKGGSVAMVNKTGLADTYDMKLKWADEQDPKADHSLPSLPTALQEQLGLKLEAQKVPVQVVVIDRAEQPSEN